MTIPVPSPQQLEDINDRYRLGISGADLGIYRDLIEGALASYARVDELYADHRPQAPVRESREPGDKENPLGAWYRRFSLKETSEGPLDGKTLAIKDNTAVAGVPMMNGSRIVEGFIPRVDATVVSRILDSGGEIVGKSVCEDLCFSAGSHTAATGPVRNPWDPSRTAGGSSGGSGALVAAGEVDMAIAGDQGGSVRIPSSFSGVCGLKATFGLVPYTGAYPIESTIDHLGPMARTIEDVATLLNVIAGPDGMDPRQSAVPLGVDYGADLDGGIEGLRVGIVSEGFGWDGLSEDTVDATVESAARRLTEAGAKVSSVSIPEHRDAVHVWNVIATDGAMGQMIRGNGYGMNYRGLYDPEQMEHSFAGWQAHANEVSKTVKFVMLCAEHSLNQNGGGAYARASNVRPLITAAVEAALMDFDVLCYPTLPFRAKPIPSSEAPVDEYIARALEVIPNTTVSSVTGFPELTIPVALGDGLPIGMSIAGRPWDEATVLRVGRTYERLVGGFALSPMARCRLSS
jgi:amidase